MTNCSEHRLTDDWQVASHAYAVEHDRGYSAVHDTTQLLTGLFIESGPEADARRARVLPRLATGEDRLPDTLMSGPDALRTR